MQKEIVLVFDFRYDEGARPRKGLICPALTTRTGRGGQPRAFNTGKMDKIRIKQATKRGYIECVRGGWQILVTQQAQQEEEGFNTWER